MKRLPFGAFKAGYWRRVPVGAEVQTRRVIVFPQGCDEFMLDVTRGLIAFGSNGMGEGLMQLDDAPVVRRIPYAVGERVAITEAFRVVYNDHYTARILYRCDEAARRVDIPEADRCKPSVHPRNTWLAARFMPVCLSRGVGTVLDVRAKPVQDISVADAIAEGCVAHYHGGYEFGYQEMDPARANFRHLWDSINAARGYGWAANPWGFVFTVRKEAAE